MCYSLRVFNYGVIMSEEDLEILAFTKMKEALEPLDEEACIRVLDWANRRYLGGSIVHASAGQKHTQNKTNSEGDLKAVAQVSTGMTSSSELSDLAEVDEDGSLDLHIRSFKAKNKIDCVNRLVHVVIYLHEKLTGEREIAGPVINKFLEDWRLYDGNARRFLAAHKGIKVKGTKGAQRTYYLDNPGKKEAEKFISEIRDDSVQGKFDPTKTQKKRAKKSAE